jgi:hypothetical protein
VSFAEIVARIERSEIRGRWLPHFAALNAGYDDATTLSILAKRTQRVLLGSSPRKRGPIITGGGYGSRLSLRSAGTTIAWSARSTNLRLCETAAGVISIVSD